MQRLDQALNATIAVFGLPRKSMLILNSNNPSERGVLVVTSGSQVTQGH